jgi:hypothetical protein
VNALRCLLAIVAGCAFGVVAAEVILGLGPRDGGICIAIIAACVILRFLIKAVQEDQEMTRRLERERVWRRRDMDPDWVFNAPYWQIPELTDKENNQ